MVQIYNTVQIHDDCIINIWVWKYLYLTLKINIKLICESKGGAVCVFSDVPLFMCFYYIIYIFLF